MSGSGVTIAINDAEITSALVGILQRTHTAQPALSEIGEYLMRSEEARFVAQISPDAEPWAGLATSTLARKRKLGLDKGTLTMYGRLRSSFHPEISDNVLEFGTNSVYARIQQFGGTVHHEARSQMLLRGTKGNRFISKKSAARRSGFTFQNADIGAHDSTIPARPFLGLSAYDRSMILEICQRWLRGEG